MQPFRPLRHVARAVVALSLGLVLLAPAPAPAQTATKAAPSLTDSLTWDPAVRRGVLPNGIRWFVKKNAKPEARVSLRLAVPVGSTAEADDQQGVAHFTEHMNFNGSAHFKNADDLVGYLRTIGLRFGADANAYTSFDETVYMLEVPTDRDSLLKTGLDALSDFAGRATMSDTEVDKERGVVMEEWRLGRGAQERIQRQQFPVLFRDSRYAVRLPIGKPEILQTVPPARVRDFYRDWYRPEWMAVIAVGDIDPAKMEALIREHFSDLPKRADAREVPRFDVPGHEQTLMVIASDKEATGSSIGILSKRPRSHERTVGDVRTGAKADLFSAMLRARFDEIAHRANAPFLGASAGGFQFNRSTDLYFVQASVKDGQQAKGLEALLEETARVRTHGFLAGELDRARTERVAQLDRAYAEREKTESSGLAAYYVDAYLNQEPAVSIEQSSALQKALLASITLAEVNALADTLLSVSNRVVSATGPEKAGAPLPTEPELRAILDRMASAKPAAWVDAGAGKVLMAKLPTPGKVTSTRTIDEIGVTVVKFSNGVEAWLKPTDFKADEILFTAYAKGGLSLADTTVLPAATLAAGIVNDGGVGGFKSTELQKMLAGKLVSVRPYAANFQHGVSGSARPEDLETALQLIHLGFVKPTEDPEAFAALKARFSAFFANRANSPEQVFADTAGLVNSGGVILYRPLTVAQVNSIELAPALDFYRKRFANAADFTFFFAGNFKNDAMIPLLARYLGSLPSTGKRTSAFVPTGPRYPEGITKVEVKKGSEPKGSVRITFFTHGQLEELDNHRASSAASILSDHLRSTMRELLGGTYSVSARFQSSSPLDGYTTMTIAFGCDPARADTLIAAALAEVKKLTETGPSAEDVSKEQEVQRREVETAMKQNGTWTGSLSTMSLLGWDPRRMAKRRERIDLLTPAALQETFKKYFPADHYSVIRLSPEVAKATP